MYAALLARKGGAAAAAQGVVNAAAAVGSPDNKTGVAKDNNDLKVSAKNQGDASSSVLAKAQSSDSDNKKVVIDYSKYDPNWKKTAPEPKKFQPGELNRQKRKEDEGGSWTKC